MPDVLHMLLNSWDNSQDYYLSFEDAELEVEEIEEVRCPSQGHITEFLSHNAQIGTYVTRPHRVYSSGSWSPGTNPTLLDYRGI